MARRQRGEGSVFKRADGMWIGQLDLGWHDGKRRRPAVSSKTQAGAVRKLRELKDKVAKSGGNLPSKGMTVEQWLTYWVNEIAPKKPKTQRFYRTNVDRHLIPAIGKHRLDRLRTEHVREMHKAIAAKTWRGKPLASTTIMHVHATLVTALEAARKEHPPRVVVNVAELVEAPKRATNSRGALTAPEARQLLRSAADDRMSSRWMAALLAGPRQGEALGLRWERVDFEHRLLDLAWQLQRITFRHGCGPAPAQRDGVWACGKKRAGSCPDRELDVPRDYEHMQLDGGLSLVRPKSAAGTRVVPIAPPLLASLTKRHQEYLDERDAYGIDHGLVWCRTDGRPVDAPDDSAAWRAACRSAGVPDVELHAARHTTATLLLEAGVDETVVQQIVGHSSAVMTRKYQHVSVELARRALDDLVQLIQIEA